MFQDFGMTILLFQALQAHWAEQSAERARQQPCPVKRVNRIKQFLAFSGGVMIMLGLKLGGQQRQLNAGWK
jgi:hypothetical protein